ncbi:ubiquitin carboxy-terminal hydrolase (macronuclear) [Tetrahymena thermophila SB210]|uniref:ubiquitinyl hydrolase 1 n=1 Tax=Tetrahymena thermophila (strain SB210) TaxID=312017 RepID=Q22ZI1_TETTS|nr:ubiquitin carboxy-terminal hydrolase [Tetrahymena thermophila SB210]EAR90666.1 ubiquitin carboxy-terminal hydrolase [Tetrahymena thermophila SB210]|eukprot:XP_001010911.1 ubiquitin carboxy-terminal hydrolase [Tetrahymena thermophila SB210]
MLGDMFDTPEDILGGVSNAQILNVQQRRPKNCASFMELPQLRREENGFVGLKNQGATCYLNSLIQSLFMSPEFRNAIYQLPLCDEDISKKSGFVDSQSKQKLLLGFQKLFGQMQSLDISSISTEELTSSFGWEANQSFQQQDIQEANRVIFDVLERALFGTAVQIDPTSFYKGTIVNHITCTECQVPREREENFYDLMLQVENISCVEESFMAFITPELLNESNQLFCEICNKKCDTLKGQKIRKFPDILTLSLNRFTFDYDKLERVKLNQKYEFGLEFNIAPFLENSDIDDSSDEYNYELFTVLIHRGSAHGGHYHTYIRDFLGEGNWEEKMKQYSQEREKREQEQKEKLEQQQQEELEKKQKEEQIKQQKQIEQQEQQKKDQDEELQDVDESNLSAQEKKDLKKKQKQQKKQQNQKSQPIKNDKKKQNEEKQNEKKKNFVAEEYEFDDQDFPRMFTNSDLAKNWYNFNDSQVKSINVNRLQKQYGGSGSENAYILIYRKKTLAKNIPNPSLPKYIEKLIQEENQKLQQERQIYEEASRHIEVYVDSHAVFQDISYTYINGYDFEKSSQLLRIKTDCTFKQLIQNISETTQISLENLAILELYEHPNKYVQTVRLIDVSNSDQTLEQAEVSHFSCWVYYDKSKHQEILDRLKPHIGQDQIPLKLNIICPGKSFSILAFSQDKLIDLKIQMQELTNIPENEQYLQNEDLQHINDSLEKEEMTLNQLKIQNDYDIIIKQIDHSHQQENQQNPSQQGKTAQLSEYQQAQLQGLVSILVENSDEPGVKRFFIDYKQLDLQKLLAFIKEKFSIEQTSLRRLRNLENKQIYFKDEYSKSLEELGFQEGGTRLLLERGEIPVSGNIPIKIKNSSKHKVAETQNMIEVLIQDDQSLHQLKCQACTTLKLDPEQHKLYKTDWMEEPIQLITNENQLIRNMNFKQQEVLVLRDNESPIDKEFEKFSIYHTINGSSEDTKYVGDLKIKKDELIQDLKNTILAMPYFLNLNKESGENNTACLRVRDMRKDGLFGQIYRKNDKKISGYNYSTNNIAVQQLSKPDNLEEDDLSLILRKRNCKAKTYEGNTEFIYKSSKKPTVDELKQQIGTSLGLADMNQFEIVKYFPYEFCWKVISNKEYDNLKETKKKQDQKSHKKNKDGKKQEQSEQKKDDKQSDVEQNLKKAPYLLKDGDIIGYVLLEEKEENDDYQTENDQKMKLWFEEEKRQKRQISTSKSKQEQHGFTINLDF